MSDEIPKRSQSNPPALDADQLNSIRAILLAGERERINSLAAETAALAQQSAAEKKNLQTELQALQEELELLQERNKQNRERAERLQMAIDQISQELTAEQENRIAFLVSKISDVLGQAAQQSRDRLAYALSPVMGQAIRNQIMESPEEMIDAISPIILRTIQKALADFARDLQRNIDARLTTTVGTIPLLRSFGSRLRGVDDGELLLREALPFAIDELFLIHRQSGLLIEYDGIELEEGREKELISGMLTAIRDFTQDSFGDNTEEEELDEIQYGDERILIESGSAAYVAAVIRGVDPTGFRTKLRDFVAQQHFLHGQALRHYDGDGQEMPDLKQALHMFRMQFMPDEKSIPQAMSTRERWLLVGGVVTIIFLLALACFYLQFTIALLPLAFGNGTTPAP